MLTQSFLLALLATVTAAHYPDEGSPKEPAVTPSPAAPSHSTSSYYDDDQPAPYKSVFIPASEKFDPKNAPAYTLDLPIVSGAAALIQSGLPRLPMYAPESVKSGSQSSSAPVQTPASKPSPAPVLIPSSVPAKSTPCTKGEAEASKTPSHASSTPAPPKATPPTGTERPAGLPDSPPNLGYGHARPSDLWPSRGHQHPESGSGYGKAPKPIHPPAPHSQHHAAASKSQASTTPCTFETRIRSTASAKPSQY